MILSRRPGRRIAGSIISGLFEAAIKKTPFRLSTPSISVNIWLTTRVVAPLSDDESDLLTQIASISSKKITHGFELRARWNNALTARSLSPTYFKIFFLILNYI